MARTNLAQVNADGAVTGFAPSPNGAVPGPGHTADGDLLAGGAFTTMAGRTAKGIARLGPGGAVVWGGNVTGGSVRALALSRDGAMVYVGGDFAQVVARSSAGGRLDALTGARRMTFAVGTPNQPVNDIVVRSTGEVLIAGSFTSVGGTGRVRLAGLDGATGALGPISVGINNTVNDLELDDAGNVVYRPGRSVPWAGRCATGSPV